ncbi:MAG: hypothetical protein DRQ40_08190 [Gammaproteobacteria bacterium]|nr:MAG: hypothetical protein DRQ40_08190 [Gammaproteobacteria bacterium]
MINAAVIFLCICVLFFLRELTKIRSQIIELSEIVRDSVAVQEIDGDRLTDLEKLTHKLKHQKP